MTIALQYLTSYISLGVWKLAQIIILPVLFKRHLIAINILSRKVVNGFGTLPVCHLRTLQKGMKHTSRVKVGDWVNHFCWWWKLAEAKVHQANPTGQKYHQNVWEKWEDRKQVNLCFTSWAHFRPFEYLFISVRLSFPYITGVVGWNAPSLAC